MNMTLQDFNLMTEPWIPVQKLDGDFVEVSLLDFFKNGAKYSHISCDPLTCFSLTKWIVGFAQAAINGPQSKNDWLNLQKNPYVMVDQCVKYCSQKKDKFNYFNGFYLNNIERLALEEKLHRYNLSLFKPSGNNQAWNVKGEDQNSISEYIRNTFLLQDFGAYIAGIEKADPTREKITRKKAFSAQENKACVFLVGKNVIETIALNMISFEKAKSADYLDEQHGEDPIGTPFWDVERENLFSSSFSKSEAINRNGLGTFYGYMCPLQYIVSYDGLNTTRPIVTNISFTPCFPGFYHSFVIYEELKETEDGKTYPNINFVSIKMDRDIHRDLAVIFTYLKRKCAVIDNLRLISDNNIDKENIGLFVTGMDSEKANSKIHSVSFFNKFFPQKFFSRDVDSTSDADYFVKYSEAIKYAEHLENKIFNCVNFYFKSSGSTKKIKKELIYTFFWTEMKNAYNALFLSKEIPVDEIKKKIYKYAMETINNFCSFNKNPKAYQLALNNFQKTKKTRKNKNEQEN